MRYLHTQARFLVQQQQKQQEEVEEDEEEEEEEKQGNFKGRMSAVLCTEERPTMAAASRRSLFSSILFSFQ